MQIAGIQKLTLLDYPGKAACTVFLSGCNFRCPYCHNASLVIPGRRHEQLGEDEILAFLEKRRGILDGAVITGGEPLLSAGLEKFILKIHALGLPVKLDTNGSMPDRLRALVEAGLIDYAAMDIKNSPALYPLTTGCSDADIAAVGESKDFLLGGSVDYEFRTTVVRGLHTVQSLTEAAKWIAGAKRYFLQPFRDSGDLVDGDGLGGFSDGEMPDFLNAVRPYVQSAELRGV